MATFSVKHNQIYSLVNVWKIMIKNHWSNLILLFTSLSARSNDTQLVFMERFGTSVCLHYISGLLSILLFICHLRYQSNGTKSFNLSIVILLWMVLFKNGWISWAIYLAWGAQGIVTKSLRQSHTVLEMNWPWVVVLLTRLYSVLPLAPKEHRN